MAGLAPAIHVFAARKAWMPGTRPSMTGAFAPSLLLQHQRAFLLDRGRNHLGELRQQPRQFHVELHVVLGDGDGSRRFLHERVHPEGEGVAVPGLLLDRKDARERRARFTNAVLDAPERLVLAETMGDRNRDRFAHASPCLTEDQTSLPCRRGSSRRKSAAPTSAKIFCRLVSDAAVATFWSDC